MRMIFAIILALAVQTVAASAQDPAFRVGDWDTYDGSQRLGLVQQECKIQGGAGSPRGYTAKELQEKLKKLSKDRAEKVLETCDPRDLDLTQNPKAVTTQATPTQTEPKPGQKRVEHPFKKISAQKQYRCWIDIEGRHRVKRDDPAATGWCWGKAVGDD